jgi:hypothetical protein
MWRRLKRLPKRLQVIYSLIALVIFAGIATFIWAIVSGKIAPLAAPGEASLSLQSDSSIYNPGVNFSVYINLDTGGTEVSEVAIRSLNYNTSVLDVVDQDENADGVQIAPGKLGDLAVSENMVDTGSGKITYVVRAGTDTAGFTGAGRVATIYFTAKASGTSNLSFDFTAGTIGDTDVIAKADKNDILVSAAAMTITIGGNEAHTVCNLSNRTCETVSGVGANQCSNDADCQVAASEHHYVCNAAKHVCLKVSGAGVNECVTYADCLKPSPAPPTAPPSPTPGEPSPSPVTLETPTPAVTQTPISIGMISPTPTMLSPAPEEGPPSPTASPETKIAGFGISKTWALILFIGIPVLITGAVFLVWWWKKKKKAEFEPSEGGEDIDDDEMI